jgi:tripartite-type tricarboxylate transporter receptor subunit TctC
MGIFAPTGLSRDIRSKLSAALVQSAKEPTAREILQKAGFEPVGMEWNAFERLVDAEAKKWRTLIKERGIRN